MTLRRYIAGTVRIRRRGDRVDLSIETDDAGALVYMTPSEARELAEAIAAAAAPPPSLPTVEQLRAWLRRAGWTRRGTVWRRLAWSVDSDGEIEVAVETIAGKENVDLWWSEQVFEPIGLMAPPAGASFIPRETSSATT